MSKILDTINSDKYHAELKKLGASEQVAHRFTSRLRSYLRVNESLLANAELAPKEFFNKVSGLVLHDLSFGDEVQLSSYKSQKGGVVMSYNIMVTGLMKMIQRVPGLQVYRPIAVSDDAHFDYKVTLINGKMEHVMEYTPSFESDGVSSDNLKCVFIGWEVTPEDGGEPIRDCAVISKASVMSSRNLSAKQRGGKATVWDEHFEQMCQKTAIRRISRYLPLAARAMIDSSSDSEEVAFTETVQPDNRPQNSDSSPAAESAPPADGDKEKPRGRGRPKGSVKSAPPEQEADEPPVPSSPPAAPPKDSSEVF